MKRKPQHGGKRKGAGRKPGSSTCPTCAILLKQLEASEVREKRLLRQLETKDEQIGTVITSKFETFNVSGPRPESSVAPGLPVEMLNDVETYDDKDFVEAAEKVVKQ